MTEYACLRVRLAALLAGAVFCGTAAAAGTVAEVEAHVPARGDDVPTYTAEVPGATPDAPPGAGAAGGAGQGATAGSSGGTVITPVPTGGSVRRRGPSVELISGGNSADGAARVGRLPVLD